VGRVIGLDVGTKTIGVAVSDPLRLFAQPLLTVRRKGLKTDLPAIQRIIDEKSVEEIVVGMPYELDGTEARSARLARQVGQGLAEATGLPLHFVDERFTSVEAERSLIRQNVSRKRRKQVIDQAAAVLILQGFLDHGAWSDDR
jgi:putative Holliday junction resolvase